MYDIDDLTDALEGAKRELERATDDYEATKRAYYDDPCATTKRKLLKAKSDLEAANAEYEELWRNPFPGNSRSPNGRMSR